MGGLNMTAKQINGESVIINDNEIGITVIVIRNDASGMSECEALKHSIQMIREVS
jgi:hypothetical protein